MKRTGTTIIVLFLIVSLLLSACGNRNPVSLASESISSTEASSAGPEETAVQDEISSETVSAVESESEELVSSGLDSKEVSEETPAAVAAVTYPLSDELITLTAYWSFNSFLSMFGVTTSTASEMSMFTAAEEATNVHLDITFVSEESYSTTLPLLWAGGDYMDLMSSAEMIYSKGADSAVEEGILLDVAPYLKEYAPDYLALLNADDSFRTDLTSYLGHIVSFASYQEYPDGGNVIRKDWLDGLGMDIPKTMDDVTDVLRAFKSEYQVKSPLLSNKNLSYLGAWSAYGVPAPSESDLSWYVKDGNVCCAQTSEEYYNALQWIAQCYQEQLLTDDFLNINQMDNNLIAGETGYCWATSVVLSDSHKEQSGDSNFLVVAIPDPTLEPGGTTDVGGTTGGQGGTSMSISAQTELPEICVAYLNYYYSEGGRTLTGFGIEGESFVYNDAGEKEYTDLILNNPDGYPTFIAQALYTGVVGTPMVITKESRLALFTNDQERESFDIWTSNRTDKLVYHGKLTDGESEIYYDKIGDLSTFANGEMLKFVTGARSLDEYDVYVAEMESMGLGDVLALKEAAYSRYLESAGE